MADLLDAKDVQDLLANFYSVAQIPVAIIDVKGNILAGIGWQEACTSFHRVHPETCRNCIESDTVLTAGVAPGEWKLYRCKNAMWDVATPLMVGGEKVGNIFSGQFFFDDEQIDYERFSEAARRYGFDEAAYIAAIERVPRISRAALNAVMAFFVKLGVMLSTLSLANLQLRRSLSERDTLTGSLTRTAALLSSAEAIAHVGSWELDVVRNRLSWSDEVYRIMGVDPGAFAPSYADFLRVVHPDDRATVDSAYGESIQSGSDSYEITHRIVRGDAHEVRWVHEKCRHVKDAAGSVVRSIGMVQDITERKQAEHDLERQNRVLAGMNRELKEFAFAASHDLQEPLRTVAIYTDLLLRHDGPRTDGVADDFRRYIASAVKRMQELIGDLVLFSHTVERPDRTYMAVDLNRSLDLAIEALRAHVQETQAVIDVEPLPYVLGDERQLARVFQNVISNALKYRRNGVAPHLEIRCAKQDSDWVISIKDNGIGFNPAYAARIFGMFKRLHRDEYTGSGLGLAICRGIVERSGGRIWAHSDGDGCGAVFSFTLPECPAPA